MLTVFLPKENIKHVLMENAMQNKLTDIIATITDNAIQITVIKNQDLGAWDGNATIVVIKIVKESDLGVKMVFAKNMFHLLDLTVLMMIYVNLIHQREHSCNVTLRKVNASINLQLEELVI